MTRGWRARRCALLIGGAAACLGAAQPPGRDSTVRSSVGFVSATIAGHGPYWFLVDTGANRSALDDDVAKALQLKTTGTSRVEGTAGVVEVAEASLGPVRFGGVEISSLNPTIYDLASSLAPDGTTTAGILGLDALQRFAILFDRTAGSVRFADHPAKLATLNRAVVIPFELDNGVPRIDAVVEGLPVKLRVDSGASIADGPKTFINITQRTYDRVKAKDPTFLPYTYFNASGVGGDIKIAVVKGRSASLGPASFAAPFYIVQPAVGYFARDDAVGFLGAYAFKTWAGFIIDYPRKRLILLNDVNPPHSG